MYYKLTDQDGCTRKGQTNECLWGENVTHAATGDGTALCSSDLIHVYEHPLIAAFMNPVHADFKNPLLWECEISGESSKEGQLKSGFKVVTTIRRIDLPVISLEQRIRISIYCALRQYSDPAFVKWANGWLDGTDRSAARAAWAAQAAWAAAEAAWAAQAAAWAAQAAARAAQAAAEAAWAAWAATAARAATAEETFDLLTIIKNVVEDGK